MLNNKKTEVRVTKNNTVIVIARNERSFIKERTGFKRYEKSQFSFGSDISDKGIYSRW